MASTSNNGSVAISKDNSALIEKFCLVTGSDNDKAKKVLEVCNWNLEMAINMHVDGDFQEPIPCDDPVAADDNVRPPIPQSCGVLVEEDMSYQFNMRGRKRRPHSVFDGFRDFRAEAELQEHSGTDEAAKSSKKRKTLEDLFRPPLDIMCRGTFESARDSGESQNKWLMVNIQDSQEFACQVLNRDVWSNEAVKRLIRNHFIFWQVYSDSIDGQRYMQFYKPVEFPYVAVLDPRTGEKLVEWHNVDSTSIVQVIELFLSGQNSLDGASSCAESTITSASKFNLLDKSEDEQLKAAMEESLKEPALVNVEDNDSDLETFDSDSESVLDKTSSVISENSNDTIDVVGTPENVKTEVEKVVPESEKTWKDYLGSEDDEKSDLVLRLPDGKREQITWPCTTKVKSLLLYISEIGYDPAAYELVTNFPRRNLCQIDVYKSLKEVDLFPREMIIVQMKS